MVVVMSIGCNASRLVACIVALAFPVGAGAQGRQLVPAPPTRFFNNVLPYMSQFNTPGASLHLNGWVTRQGVLVNMPGPLIAEGEHSVTVVWTIPDPAGPANILEFSGGIEAFPESPVLLLMSSTPGTFDPGAWGPWLPGSLDVPQVGMYHLGPHPIAVIDGFGTFRPFEPQSITDASGSMPLTGGVNLDIPRHLTVQAVVVDPTTLLGLRLTGALAITKHL